MFYIVKLTVFKQVDKMEKLMEGCGNRTKSIWGNSAFEGRERKQNTKNE
jgi:hypothetical protein